MRNLSYDIRGGPRRYVKLWPCLRSDRPGYGEGRGETLLLVTMAGALVPIPEFFLDYFRRESLNFEICPGSG